MIRRFSVVMFRIALCVLLAAVGWGCAGTGATAERRADQASAPIDVGGWESIGTSVEGRDIRAWSWGRGDRRALLVGTIHGNERSGGELLDLFVAYVRAHPETISGWRVTVIPVANPDGLEGNTRLNANGIDLNRNFPTANFQPSARRGEHPASEPETRALMHLMDAERPDVIVSVHAPLACVDYDGPGQSLARRMSALCGLPVKKLGARPGSLGSFAGVDRRIPIITLELTRKHSVETPAQQQALDALLTVCEPDETTLAK